MDIRTIDKEKRQYALNNFAGIVKSLEYFENNFDEICEQPTDILILAAIGYYVSLASLIKNKQGMDYTKIFELLQYAIGENTDYTDLNKGLSHNISVLREWEESLKYEMKHILTVRDKYFAHIDFVANDFLLNHIKSKDKSKQSDLIKFFRHIIVVCDDYSTAVMATHQKRHG